MLLQIVPENLQRAAERQQAPAAKGAIGVGADELTVLQLPDITLLAREAPIDLTLSGSRQFPRQGFTTRTPRAYNI